MSCLFNSLSSFINNINTIQLRKIIVDNISKNIIIMEPNMRISDIIKHEFKNMTLKKYVSKMSLSHQWGGAIEIKVFCEIFHYKVNVLVLQTKKIIEFFPTNNIKKVITITWNGTHYEPLKN
jgi:hypothetical protein